MREPTVVDWPDVAPREVVTSYDAEYDIPSRQHHAIALLELHRAFDSEDPAVRVGASWCRMVRADVEYRAADGLAEIEAARGHAAALFEDLRAGRGDDFARYACARWHDGAGRVFFRCGDYAEAIVLFERALSLVERADALRHCRADIASNLLRARFDVIDAAHRQEIDGTARDEIHRHRERLADELRDRLRSGERRDGSPGDGTDGAAGVDPTTYAASWLVPAREGALGVAEREHLRGLCNLAHNLSVVLPRARTGRADEAREWSRCSERIALALGDAYRAAQALVQQAIWLGRDERALPIYERLRGDLGASWKRGTVIARQNIAWIRHDRAALKAMLDEFDRRLSHRDATTGLDYRLLQFTARRLRECAGAPDPSYDPHAYELRAVRAVRHVVKIAHYKRLFADQMRPVFLAEVGRRLDAVRDGGDGGEDPREALVAVVEESSARELLDLVGAAVAEEPTARSEPEDDGSQPPYALEADDGTRRRGGARRVAANEPDVIAQIEQQRRAWEEHMAGRPIPVREHDADIGRALRAMTAQGLGAGEGAPRSGTCIVRYFEYGDGAELGALVYARGEAPRLVDRLDGAALRRLADGLAAKDGPDPSDAVALFDLAIRPLGEIRNAEHLVIIPAGPLFRLPLHVACDGESLLGARVPLSFSVSATAFLTGRRHLLRSLPVDEDDDLCALIPAYGVAERLAADDVEIDWGRDHFYIAGAQPYGIAREAFKYVGDGDLDGLARLAGVHPEFFVYVGHGAIDSTGEPLLRLQNRTIATPYALLTPRPNVSGAAGAGPGADSPARSARLSRNKWTILAGCVSGQQSETPGGEVAGFVRAFTAAGAGALVLALWHVQSSSAAATTRALLGRALAARGAVVDIVAATRDHYAEQRSAALDVWIQRCPFVVYL